MGGFFRRMAAEGNVDQSVWNESGVVREAHGNSEVVRARDARDRPAPRAGDRIRSEVPGNDDHRRGVAGDAGLREVEGDYVPYGFLDDTPGERGYGTTAVPARAIGRHDAGAADRSGLQELPRLRQAAGRRFDDGFGVQVRCWQDVDAHQRPWRREHMLDIP